MRTSSTGSGIQLGSSHGLGGQGSAPPSQTSTPSAANSKLAGYGAPGLMLCTRQPLLLNVAKGMQPPLACFGIGACGACLECGRGVEVGGRGPPCRSCSPCGASTRPSPACTPHPAAAVAHLHSSAPGCSAPSQLPGVPAGRQRWGRAGSTGKLLEAALHSLEFLDYVPSLRLIAALLGDGRCAILRVSEAGLQPSEHIEFSHWLCRAAWAPPPSAQGGLLSVLLVHQAFISGPAVRV